MSHRFALTGTTGTISAMVNSIILSGTRTRSGVVTNQPKFASCITGGGGSFFMYFLSHAGASSSFLEGIVPYDKQSALDFLSQHNEDADSIGFCSKEMAVKMSQCSHQRAMELTPLLTDWPSLYGVSCTATIVSHYKRRGDYRTHVAATNSFNETSTTCFKFKKGYRRRHEEEAACADLAVKALYEMTGHHDIDSSSFAITEEPQNLADRTNDVGEVGEGVEDVPELIPFPSANPPSHTVLIQPASRGDRPIKVVAPESRLPRNSVVVFPHPSFNIPASFVLLLEKEELEREGVIGKSWTRYQPSTLIFANEHTPPDIFSSLEYFAPDDENDASTQIENWGLLTEHKGEGSIGTPHFCSILSTMNKYKTCAATWLLSLDDFASAVERNSALLASIVDNGGKFAVDCNSGKIKGAMESIRGGPEAFFKIAYSLILLNPEKTTMSYDFSDGSSSTRGIRSITSGDDTAGGGGGFAVCKFDNGIIYSGFYVDSQFHGLGSKVYSKGGGYLGTWENFKRQGEGISVYDGKWGYQEWRGPFVNDVPHGVGIMIDVDGSAGEFEFVQGEPAKIISIMSITLAKEALEHFTNSPTPFHNVANLCTMLGNDFVKLNELEKWEGTLKPGGKYYFTRNTSTIVAFVIGGAYDAAAPGGFKVIGGHTDSPNLRIKPCSKKSGAGNITQLNVECYGGGLWHTWFDRDLSVAGRVIVKKSDGTFKQELVNLKKPICRVPSLCIHLQTGDERAAFKVNKEDHLQPVFAQFVKDTLEVPTEKKQKTKTAWEEGHDPILLSMIASELNIETSSIADFELSLYDTQPACLGGANDEFLYSARLDNQGTCFTSITSLAQYSKSDYVGKDKDISMVCLFDHEEVGSASQCGAGSPILGEAVRRASSALNNGAGSEDFFQVTLRRSFVFSVDMAHAVHPNYAHKHEKNHAPKLNAGVVIKTNQNQRYTTNAFTGFVIREIGRRKEVPIQEFVVRNDCPCGSTIGPIISENTGIRCVDAGMSQLSMHSCREMMGSHDLKLCVDLFNGFFECFREIDECCYDCS